MRYHRTIKTISVHNWRESSKDVRFVRVGYDEHLGDYDEQDNPDGNTEESDGDKEVYKSLQEEYVVHFGLGDETLDLHNLEKSFRIAQINALFDPIAINDVNRIAHEIKELLDSAKVQSVKTIDSRLLDVEIWLGREIDLFTMSVFKLNLTLQKFRKYCHDRNAAIENHKRS